MRQPLPAMQQRVLDMLWKRKSLGVTVKDFPVGFRLGARIFDLRQIGYAIQTITEEMKSGARIGRYVLTGKKRHGTR